ncbi:MAG TPA: 3D domain-containing protein [Kofleriaceae bacterium]|nr:3D domain-containing protein [Kofleriaceae bacterium]
MRCLALLVLAAASAVVATGVAAADTSKLAKDGLHVMERRPLRGKNKLCCGYQLVPELQWALRFYWLAREEDFDEPDEIEYQDVDSTDIYNRRGFYVGTFSQKFIWHLRMEGSGLLADGRVINYAGACKYGTGTCFETLDWREYPFGRGARRRTLTPFKSVAVDPKLIPLGEPLYIVEFDGMRLPDGSVHDGCVRADDTGGGIKLRKMDFFVVTYGNFRWLLQELWGVNWITPVVEAPRCEYLRDT